ncbi:hypothetical protein JW933_00320 [candidate division FCPU426 bacterium]|nr:hypothetical protein [candidate division FCPU426 bacterium]
MKTSLSKHPQNLLAVTAVMACLAALVAAQPAAANSMPERLREAGFQCQSAQWTTHTVRREGKNTVEFQSQVWLSRDKYCMEAKDPKQGKTMVYLDTGKEKYLCTPDEKKAVRLTPVLQSMYAGFLNSDMIAQHALQRKQAKVIGQENLDNKPCEIVTYQSVLDTGEETVAVQVKEWIWREKNIPLKSVIKIPPSTMRIGSATVDVPASETMTTIADLVLDQPIPDSRFMLPAGTQLADQKSTPGKGP